MSNRVRILFHCGLEGPQTCHVGNQALKSMERLVRHACRMADSPMDVSEEWISEPEWLLRGRPKFTKRALQLKTFGSERKYLVTKKPIFKACPTEIPVFKERLARARWLWENLPPQVRVHCCLKILRESRRSAWRRSASNPAHWGWNAVPAPTAHPALQTPLEGVAQSPQGPAFGSLHAGHIEALLHGDGTHSWSSPVPLPEAPVPQAQDSDTLKSPAILDAQLKAFKAKWDARVPAKPKPPRSKKAGLTFKKHNLAYATDEAFASEDAEPQMPASHGKLSGGSIPATPAKEVKPKLRLGIWS